MPMPRPNLLWIFCDQLRAQALSCNGDPNISTPNIDRLAREGVNFSLACSQYPVCSPFRAGLVTANHAHINGLRVHGDLLPPDRRTIAHAFTAAGYRTSWYGKWHMASVQGVLGWKAGADYWVHPLLRGGFEDWCGFDCSNHYYNTRYSRGTQIDPPIKLEGYQTDALTDLSLEYLRTTARDLNAQGTPWFHVLSVEAPHPGTDLDGSFGNPAPPEYTKRFDPAKLILRGNVPPAEEPATRKRLAAYYAQIANLDDNVGRILKYLDDSGQADHTLVCFFSDHGELGGSHGLYEKMEVFDESIRIPLIMRLPKSQSPQSAGLTISTPTSGLDIFPTCAALCGVTPLAPIQGFDHSPKILGSAAPAPTEVLIQWLGPALYGFANYAFRAIRTARHTYCISTDPTRCVLFDNLTDPLQLHNLYNTPNSRPLQTELHARLVRQILASNEPLPAFIPPALS